MKSRLPAILLTLGLLNFVSFAQSYGTVLFSDDFSKPAIKPKYDRGVIDTWWYDTEKAAKTKK